MSTFIQSKLIIADKALFEQFRIIRYDNIDNADSVLFVFRVFPKGMETLWRHSGSVG